MMVDAGIVFLDEVGAGVNRTLLNTIADAIKRLNKEVILLSSLNTLVLLRSFVIL